VAHQLFGSRRRGVAKKIAVASISSARHPDSLARASETQLARAPTRGTRTASEDSSLPLAARFYAFFELFANELARAKGSPMGLPRHSDGAWHTFYFFDEGRPLFFFA